MFLHFFCLANIYRPSLGEVQLGRPNSTPLQGLNFYLRKKNSELHALHPNCPIFNFNFHLFFNFFLLFSKKQIKIFNFYFNIILIVFILIQTLITLGFLLVKYKSLQSNIQYNCIIVKQLLLVTDVGPPYKYKEPTYTIHLTDMPHKFITNKM